MKKVLISVFTLLITFSASAQEYTRQDTLRGSITPERAWWDLTYYHLELEVMPKTKSIKGQNLIRYEVLENQSVMQIDLQPPLKITGVMQNGETLEFTSEENAHFVKLKSNQEVSQINEILVKYEGKPKEAERAPWDGGFSWTKDANGVDFIATSCQGLGASVWWPCKDHMSDEVDSMRISVEVPDHLANISNGRLIGVERNRNKSTKTYHWEVKNPINNYGVNVNIGDYVNWKEVYNGEKGDLDITYWALKDDEEKAGKQFTEVPRMLDAFEHWFGPYPFYEDGYQLVQAPYLGMEHQSSVTYGNRFQNGYLGRDLSNTGWGLKFDFIIVHESGHEWFANNITHKDAADMWIHESFTNYSESLFLDYHFGKAAGQEYVRGTRAAIQNRAPMIARYGVNAGTPGDVYYKGGNLLNMLRTIVNDDEQWRSLLRGMNKEFYHQTIKSAQLEAYIAEFLKLDLDTFFNQYLRDRRIPTLEYYFKENMLNVRWINSVSGFRMPVDVQISGKKMRIFPTNSWTRTNQTEGSLTVDPNYYIGVLKSR